MYRINELLKLDRKLFHTNDLAILWGITNKNTLYTTIKRYVKSGILIPIYKGLYSTIHIAQLNYQDLGKAIIHRYTYLSTESVLSLAGIISQSTYRYTFVSDINKSASVGSSSFLFRKLKDDYLYNPVGIIQENSNFMATIERAVADLLYFSPRYHFDVLQGIDMDQVKRMQKEIGYPCLI